MKLFLEDGDWSPEETAMWLEGWNFQSPTSGMGRSARNWVSPPVVNNLISHPYVIESPYKS